MKLTFIFMFSFFVSFAQQPFSFDKVNNAVRYKSIYYNVAELSLKDNYHYIKHDDNSAHKNVVLYIQSNFNPRKLDSNIVMGRVVHKAEKITFRPNQFIDSIICDFVWIPDKSFLRIGLFNFLIIQNKKGNTVKEYLLNSNKEKQQYLFDYLLKELVKIKTAISNTNEYSIADLSFIRYYSSHSRYEKFPSDSVSKIREDEIRDSFGIDKYSLHEDFPLDTQNISLLKHFLVSKQRIEELSFCTFKPHHYLVFYDSERKQVGRLEICFECSDYKGTIYPLKLEVRGPLYEENTNVFKEHFKKRGIKNIE